MKVEENGQITIPPELQKAFGFTPGVEVHWVSQDGKLVLEKGTRRELAEKWVKEKAGQGQGKIDVDQWLKETRSEV